jgi:hypothetical protein
MIPLAEVRRALLILDHHLSWVERELDLQTATEINRMIRRTAEQSERAYKKCRITLCETCNAILAIYPDMDRATIHRQHKIDAQRM